jgi:S1-C subfamily serine protease
MGTITGGLERDNRTETGLAIPAYEIAGVVEYLKKNGDRYAGYIGLTAAEIEITPPITLSAASQLASSGAGSNDRTISRAILVTEVERLSPAARAGIAVGDMLLKIGGHETHSALEMSRLIRRSHPGSQLQVDLLRDHRLLKAQIQVARAPLAFRQQPVAVQPRPTNRTLDSMRLEISSLKKALSELEARLQGIH